MCIDIKLEAFLDGKSMELDTSIGKRQVSTGLEEEGKGEGVSGEGRAANVLHLLVDMDGFLGITTQRIVSYKIVPYSHASFIDVVAMESGGEELGVHLD